MPLRFRDCRSAALTLTPQAEAEGVGSGSEGRPLHFGRGRGLFSACPTGADFFITITEMRESPFSRREEEGLRDAFEAVPPPFAYIAGLCDSVKHIGVNSVLPHSRSQDIHD